ncbi:MAG: MFS transporter [Hyphomicrobiales bacterium]|nr:MAG: MFS transporter [Hyphomicrobiales bacterium]
MSADRSQAIGLTEKKALPEGNVIFNIGYLKELVTLWRPLLAATIGISGGIGMSVYAQSVMSPFIIAEFGWTRSVFALVGMTGLLGVIIIPLAGRLTDYFGTRLTILPGVIGYPIGWALFSTMDGSLAMYIGLSILNLIFGTFTASVVYSRVIAVHFQRARGLALALMISGPAVVGAIGAPLLSAFVEENGWRAGYLAIAGFAAIMGPLAFALMPSEKPEKLLRRGGNRNWSDYRLVFSSRAFWVIFGGMALCNIPNLLHASQMSIMLIDRGMTMIEAGSIISVYATGVIIGRLASGLALDRFPPEPIAVIGMGLPAIGLALLAVGSPTFTVIAFAMMLVGLSQGAESDIGAILTIKYFDLNIYGTVFSLILSNAVLTGVLGTMILSYTLHMTDSFTMFLILSTGCVVVGSLLFALLGRTVKPVAP